VSLSNSAAAAITLEGRDIHLLHGRTQLELRQDGYSRYGQWQAAGRIGVKGRLNLGDDSLDGVLAGTESFSIDTDDKGVVAGFVGGQVSLEMRDGVSVFTGGSAVRFHWRCATA